MFFAVIYFFSNIMYSSIKFISMFYKVMTTTSCYIMFFDN